MGSNVYYQPEDFGLEVIAEIDYSSQNYEFDTRVVWRHVETGILYTARDSGCSCPTPFETYESISELELADYDELRREIQDALTPNPEYTWSKIHITPEEGQEFLEAVRQVIKK